MKILLKKIKLSNFYSHENTTINFDETTKLLLDGESGAGKSAILESIIFALYGESRTDSKSIVRSRSKKAVVTLELVDGNSNITIERSMSSTGKHLLEVLVDGIAHQLTGIKELQNWIEKELIGASYLLFVNSVAYMQGNTDSFVAQTAAKRKELLLEIVKAENYDEYYEKAKEVLSTISLQKQSLEIQVTTLNSEILNASDIISNESTFKEDLKKISGEIISLDKKKEELLKLVAKFEESEKNIKLCEDRLTASERDVNRSKEALGALRIQLKDLDALTFVQEDYNALEAKNRSNLDVLSSLETVLASVIDAEKKRNAFLLTKPQVIDTSSTVAMYKKQIEDFSGKMECPSGDSCPHQLNIVKAIENNKYQIEELTKKQASEIIAVCSWEEELQHNCPVIGDIKEIMLKITGLRSEMSVGTQKLSEMDKVKAKIESMSVTRSQLPFLEKDLSDKISFRDATIIELDAIKKSNSSTGASDIKTELLETNLDLSAKRTMESSINSQLLLVGNAKEILASKKTELVNIQENLLPELTRNFNDVTLVKEAFGSKGLKTVIIDFILPKLEDKVNTVLSQLSDFTVRLDTQQLKADGEGNKEGLFITLINELGQELPYENYSGGEKLKINVAIAEALASLQKVGFRLMDETFMSLDENSTESFALVLEKLQSNFNQVVMISHLREIKEMFEDKITVTKRNGMSQIAWQG